MVITIANSDPTANAGPDLAARNGQAVTLDARGRVAGARLERGSGHAILDEAAVRAARSLKSLPAGAGETVLPVSFRLR